MKHYRDENYEQMFLPKGNVLINLSTGEESKVQPIEKHYSCELKDFNEKERTFLAVASTEAVDRDGDILRANGWKLKHFKQNPVVLLFHNAHDFPIAKSIETYTEDGKLFFKPKFATKEMNPMAEYAWQMYKNKFMRAFSVRFDPIKWTEIEPEDGEKADAWSRGIEYKSQELLEISMVNIPANPEALKSSMMHDFVVKSFIVGNSKRFPGIDFSKIFKDEDDRVKGFDFTKDLKGKYDRIDELKRIKEKTVIESALDQEIKTLEDNLDTDKAIESLSDNIDTIRDTVNKLAK